MGDLISSEAAVPGQRLGADVLSQEQDFIPAGNYDRPLAPKSLAETVEDDFVEICNSIAAGDYLAAVTIAAWDERYVDETDNADATVRERVRGSVALALEFYHISENPTMKSHLLNKEPNKETKKKQAA